MSSTKDHPGIYVPPPLMYAGIFFLSFLIQKLLPLSKSFFHSVMAVVIGTVFVVIALFFNIPALRQFAKTKNTIVTIKPATSLQTTGIFAITRNPMYISLLLLYTGLAFLFGNWWAILLLPVLVVIVTYFMIKPEERYLERAFGKAYLEYKAKVGRWF